MAGSLFGPLTGTGSPEYTALLNNIVVDTAFGGGELIKIAREERYSEKEH